MEIWHAPEGGTVNATCYSTDLDSVRELAQFPNPPRSKGQVQRWYDSEAKSTYGDDRLPDPH